MTGGNILVLRSGQMIQFMRYPQPYAVVATRQSPLKKAFTPTLKRRTNGKSQGMRR